MASVIDPPQVGDIGVDVDLRSVDIRVPQDGLYVANVRAALHKGSGATVTQHVWRYTLPDGCAGDPGNNLPNALARKRLPIATEE
jgi:hypothetical protein